MWAQCRLTKTMSYMMARCRRKRSKKDKKEKRGENNWQETLEVDGSDPLASQTRAKHLGEAVTGLWLRMGKRGKSLKSSQKWYPDGMIRKPGEKLLLWDGSGFLVTGMLLLLLSAGFQAVSRVSVETIATLASAENISIYRNYNKSSIKSNMTALHFIFIHPTATLLWGIWVWRFFFYNKNNIWSPSGVFPPTIHLAFHISKGKSWKNFADCFLLQVKKKVHDVKSEHQDFVNV